MKKRDQIIYWIATIWLATGMFSTGMVQLLKGKEGPGGVNMMTHLGYPVYFLTLLGIGKMLGVAAVLVPGFRWIKEWAYAGFFFMMSGAVASHLISSDPFTACFPALLLLGLTVVSRYLMPGARKLMHVSPSFPEKRKTQNAAL